MRPVLLFWERYVWQDPQQSKLPVLAVLFTTRRMGNRNQPPPGISQKTMTYSKAYIFLINNVSAASLA